MLFFSVFFSARTISHCWALKALQFYLPMNIPLRAQSCGSVICLTPVNVSTFFFLFLHPHHHQLHPSVCPASVWCLISLLFHFKNEEKERNRIEMMLSLFVCLFVSCALVLILISLSLSFSFFFPSFSFFLLWVQFDTEKQTVIHHSIEFVSRKEKGRRILSNEIIILNWKHLKTQPKKQEEETFRKRDTESDLYQTYQTWLQLLRQHLWSWSSCECIKNVVLVKNNTCETVKVIPGDDYKNLQLFWYILIRIKIWYKYINLYLIRDKFTPHSLNQELSFLSNKQRKRCINHYFARKNIVTISVNLLLYPTTDTPVTSEQSSASAS